MAEGLRIRQKDPNAWGVILIVPHPRKNYHIHVDGNGFAYVAPQIWRRLQEASAIVDHGFELVNTVKHPPGITIRMGVAENKRTLALADRAMREIVPNGTQIRVGR